MWAALCVLLIVLGIMWAVMVSRSGTGTIEHFYDNIPYKYQWNVSKCLSAGCVKRTSYNCYRGCNALGMDTEEGCQAKCLDIGDMVFDSIKYQNYTWQGLLPKFNKFSLLNAK